MNEYFSPLNEKEFQKLLEAIPLITVLIAGADGKIGKDETDWAEKVTKIRSYKMSADLIGFYQEVGKTFHDKLEAYIQDFPKHVGDRQKLISERLKELNPIMAKLDQSVGSNLYRSFTSFAEHVAKASGGFLGFFSIGPKEGELIDLPMIKPIEPPQIEEEE